MNEPIKYGGPEMGLIWRVLPPWANWLVACHEEGRVLVSAAKPNLVNGLHVPPKGKATSLYLNIDTNNIDPAGSLLERPYEWKAPDENTPVDAKVWVRHRLEALWVLRYHAAVAGGHCLAWDNGTTSQHALHAAVWQYAILADPDNPDRKPPVDFVLEAKP